MSFIKTKDREVMKSLIYSLSKTGGVNKIHEIKIKEGLVNFPESFNKEVTMPEVLNDLEENITNEGVSLESLGVGSLDEVSTVSTFIDHFKNDYELLNDLKAFIRYESSEKGVNINEAQDLYSKYEGPHKCLSLAFMPMNFG